MIAPQAWLDTKLPLPIWACLGGHSMRICKLESRRCLKMQARQGYKAGDEATAWMAKS